MAASWAGRVSRLVDVFLAKGESAFDKNIKIMYSRQRVTITRHDFNDSLPNGFALNMPKELMLYYTPCMTHTNTIYGEAHGSIW